MVVVRSGWDVRSRSSSVSARSTPAGSQTDGGRESRESAQRWGVTG
jgi:hypothetical protein